MSAVYYVYSPPTHMHRLSVSLIRVPLFSPLFVFRRVPVLDVERLDLPPALFVLLSCKWLFSLFCNTVNSLLDTKLENSCRNVF